MNHLVVVRVVSFLGLLLACKSQAASVASLPDQIVSLQVDTSSLTGTTGSIDFQFNPGPNTVETASVNITNFQGATSSSDQQTGAVAGGPFPNQLSINNSDVLNEDLEDVTFTRTLSFKLDFSGVAINNPSSQRPQSGSAFTIGLFSDPKATVPSLIDPSGVAFEADISPSGQFTTMLDSSQASITAEPAYLPFVMVVVLGLGSFRRKLKAHGTQLLSFFIAGALLCGSTQLFAQSCNLSSLEGSYTGTVAGHTPNGTPVAYQAIAHFNGTGGFSLSGFTYVSNGTVVATDATATGGTYIVNRDCSGSIQITSGGQTFKFAILITGPNRSQFQMLETDGTATTTGNAVKQEEAQGRP